MATRKTDATRRRNAKNRAAKAEPALPQRSRGAKFNGSHHVPIPVNTVSEDALDALRAEHPDVTDRQAMFVQCWLQSGLSVKQFSAAAGYNENWAYQMLAKEHVANYRAALARRALGWMAIDALHKMHSLLESKSQFVQLEAAKDLLNRAGLSSEQKPAGTTVKVSINL